MTSQELAAQIGELGRHESFLGLLASLRAREGALQMLTGLAPAAAAAYAVLLQRRTGRPLLVLAATQADSESMHRAILAWDGLAGGTAADAAPCLLPAHDVTPFDGMSPHPDIAGSRGGVLWRMAEGRVSVITVPVAGALQRVGPPGLYRNLAYQFKVGDEVLLESLEASLESVGYGRRDPVEMVGQFAVRGGIVDLFAPESEHPVRVELFGDEIESIRAFDPATQQSVRRLPSVAVLPMQEFPAGGSGNGLLPAGWEFSAVDPEWRSCTLLDLVPDAIVLWHEPQAIAREAADLRERLESAAAASGGSVGEFLIDLDRLADLSRARKQVVFDELGLQSQHPGPAAASWHIPSQSAAHFQGNIDHCAREIAARVAAGTRVLVAAATAGEVQRLADMFGEWGVPYQLVLGDRMPGLSRHLREKAAVAGPAASAVVVQSAIMRGCMLPDSRIAVYGTHDILAREPAPPQRAVRDSAASAFLTGLDELREGDHVVHAQHGVGRFLGTRCVTTGERSDDFMLLEYAEGSKLYVPLTRLDLVHPYHGAGGPAPQLDRLGGHTWEKTKQRVKTRLLDMAEDLLKIHARRRLGRGFRYSADGNWQREFEGAFAHSPTTDQKAAISEIKRDLESPNIMDRLVCGDVGFGKTEVAMRAAFKVLGDDKQVAVLVPTTVLAYQHLETFRRRFEAFEGVEIEMLSRFRTPKEQKEVLRRLGAGLIDIVIGTHRLLSADVRFSDLGLLIVDEEQRFGVRHKERLKEVRKTVDVLSLTATPIPRTLYMSLMGLRDLSVIKTPPQDRLAIQTVVAEYDDRIVETAIRREVARKGQVYFLHNRVQSIADAAGRLAATMPEVRFRVAHGQMNERDLEGIMLGFMRHDFDVLVATTIIENGLDIPRANTIIVDHADRHGLAELYQLRGRVGRSDRRAYAYLLIPGDRELTDIARKRLAALREFSELGAGFKMAALDLELRGAGNLLGAEQSGQIAAVGFETFTQLLEEAVQKLRGEDVEESVQTSMKLQMDFHIPTQYVPEEAQRLQLYHRLGSVQDAARREAAATELQDRYGPVPEAVNNLLDLSILKHRTEALRIPLIERRASGLIVKFRHDSKVDPDRILRFVQETQGASFRPDGTLEWTGFAYRGPAVFDEIHHLLTSVAA